MRQKPKIDPTPKKDKQEKIRPNFFPYESGHARRIQQNEKLLEQIGLEKQIDELDSVMWPKMVEERFAQILAPVETKKIDHHFSRPSPPPSTASKMIKTEKEQVEELAVQLPDPVRSELVRKREIALQKARNRKLEKEGFNLFGSNWRPLLDNGKLAPPALLEYDVSNDVIGFLAQVLSFSKDEVRSQQFKRWDPEDQEAMDNYYSSRFQNYQFLLQGPRPVSQSMRDRFFLQHIEKLSSILTRDPFLPPSMYRTGDFVNYLTDYSCDDSIEEFFETTGDQESILYSPFWTSLSSFSVEERFARLFALLQRSFSSLKVQWPPVHSPLFQQQTYTWVVRAQIVGIKQLSGSCALREEHDHHLYLDYDYDLSLLWHASIVKKPLSSDEVDPDELRTSDATIYRGFVRVLNFCSQYEGFPFEVDVESPWININQKWTGEHEDDLEIEDHFYDMQGNRVSSLHPKQQLVEDLILQELIPQIENRIDLLLNLIKKVFQMKPNPPRRRRTKKPLQPVISESLNILRKDFESRRIQYLINQSSLISSFISASLILVPISYIFWNSK